jgi:hypothetical protein
MPTTPIARVSRRTIALFAAVLVLGVPAAAYGGSTVPSGGSTVPSGGSDEDFCLDTPPGVPVNEFNCPITTTSSSTVPPPATTTPRVRSKPRFTG